MMTARLKRGSPIPGMATKSLPASVSPDVSLID
jgi:hypothetical protein